MERKCGAMAVGQALYEIRVLVHSSDIRFYLFPFMEKDR